MREPIEDLHHDMAMRSSPYSGEIFPLTPQPRISITKPFVGAFPNPLTHDIEGFVKSFYSSLFPPEEDKMKLYLVYVIDKKTFEVDEYTMPARNGQQAREKVILEDEDITAETLDRYQLEVRFICVIEDYFEELEFEIG